MQLFYAPDLDPASGSYLLGEEEILGCEQGFGQRPYSLHLAVAPTKNVDRYEWFAEKATEIGVDRITPVLTDRCERRTLRIDRILRVVTGAMKQSLKAYLPRVDSPMPLRELLELPCAGSRLIAHCEESGFRAVALGRSRLRTETAGVVAAHSVAFVNGW